MADVQICLPHRGEVIDIFKPRLRLGEDMTWTARYRFRVSKPLASDDVQLMLNIGGREAVISSSNNAPLKESTWLILNVHDFEDENTAREFGQRVADALILAGVRCDLGVDGGKDEASTKFSNAMVSEMEKHGRKLMPNVHGLLVYERTGRESFLQFNATVVVAENPQRVIDEISSSFDLIDGLGVRERIALTLVASSKMAREPLAEAALCISAVEFLSSDIPWSVAQRNLLEKLQLFAASSPDLPEDEAREVADGIKRVFKSIRQSIRRKMKSLGLTEEDWKAFDEVYSLRSSIFHGAVVDKSRHTELASKARKICTRVVLAAEMQARSI
jgi:hypothetical protein